MSGEFAVFIGLLFISSFFFLLQEHRNLPFMRELRYLFALLVGTKRKYVDPSRAVEILKDAFKSNDSQQLASWLFLFSRNLINLRPLFQGCRLS